VGPLGLVGSGVALLGTLIAAVLVPVNLLYALGMGALTGLVLVPLIPTRSGRTGWGEAIARLAWWRGRAKGQHVYEAGPLSPGARFRLPGLAAAIVAHEATDAAGQPFALLLHPSAGGTATAVLGIQPEGEALIDEADRDRMVATLGGWQAALGHEPGLIAAAIVIETAPDPGTRLAAELAARRSPDAPALSVAVLDDIAATYPRSAGLLRGWATLTWTRTPTTFGARKALQTTADELGRRVPALALALADTGAGAPAALTRGELARAVRAAFSPSEAAALDAGRAVEWEDCGPAGALEEPGLYHHDESTSITWAMVGAPRGAVGSSILTPLLAPHPALPVKRVTLLYRPINPASAARMVERDRRTTRFRAAAKRQAKAVDDVAVLAAEQQAIEEAHGAGLVRFGLLVTVTVPAGDPEAIAAAVAAVGGLAAQSRIELRRCWRWQPTAFLGALPLGLVLPLQTRIPPSLREAM